MKPAKNNPRFAHTPVAAADRRLEQIKFFALTRSLIARVVFVAAAVIIVFTVVFGLRIQSGEGMYPRVRDGDLMLYYRLSSGYSVGDIITLHNDEKVYTGRVVAIAGDIVNTSTEGKLIVNGAIQFEEIYYDTFVQSSVITLPYTVPANSYFILGDMRTGATDSRDIGAVPRSQIEGKLIAILRRRGL